MEKEKPTTKLCKYCQSEIPYKAKICPHCRKKQGGGILLGILKAILVFFLILIVIGMFSGGEGKDDKEPEKSSAKQTEAQTTPAPIEYIKVTADELVEAVKTNAMKAQNDYKGQYLEISGRLGSIDSDGKYIDIDSSADFDFTIIQCYLKTDEHKEVILNKAHGDPIVVRGYCKGVGEVIGYTIDIDSVE